MVEENELGSLTNAPREMNEIATLALTAIKEFKEAMINNQIASPVDPDDAENVKVKKPKPQKEGTLVISPPRGLLVPGQPGPYDMAISKGKYTPGRGWVGNDGEQIDKGKLSQFVLGTEPLAVTGKHPSVKEEGETTPVSFTEEAGKEDLEQKGILGLQIGEGDPDADVIVETLKTLMTELARTLKVINEQKMTQRIPSPTAHQPGDMRPGNDRDQPNYPENKE